MSTPAARPDDRYTVFRAEWRGISLKIRHCPMWSKAVEIDHIEVVSDKRVPLPITETGYKSHFLTPEQIADIGTPVDYVMAWLGHAAQSETWKRNEAGSRQLSLF